MSEAEPRPPRENPWPLGIVLTVFGVGVGYVAMGYWRRGPLVMALAWFYGETVTTANIAGAALVTIGVVLCLLGNPDEVPDP